MSELEIAAQLFVLQGLDQVSAFLKMQEVLGTADPAKVMAAYEKIKAGKVKVVKVATSLALSEQQKQQMVQKLRTKFSKDELVFAYVVDSSIAYGIEIKIGDDLIEFSFI
jgi:F0F1-type ATP synthase delta subunit